MQISTLACLVSLGLMQRMKKGLQEFNVFIKTSNELLNWEDKVTVLLEAPSCLKSNSNIFFRYEFVDLWINAFKS